MAGHKRPLNKEDIEIMLVMIDYANQKTGMFGGDFTKQASKDLSRVETVTEDAVRLRAYKAKVAARRFMAGEKVRWEVAFGGDAMLPAPAAPTPAGGKDAKASKQSTSTSTKAAITKKRKKSSTGDEGTDGEDDLVGGEGPSASKGVTLNKGTKKKGYMDVSE